MMIAASLNTANRGSVQVGGLEVSALMERFFQTLWEAERREFSDSELEGLIREFHDEPELEAEGRALAADLAAFRGQYGAFWAQLHEV